jgi:hypothetical protein
VLRHEEFAETCAAACNGKYNNRWSKTMVGYGDESTNFTIELTYNYGVKSYRWGNDFGGVTIQSKDIIERVKSNNYPFKEEKDGGISVKAPDGYTFFIINNDVSTGEDPISNIIYNVTSLEATIKYWHGILNMDIIKKDEKTALLSFNGGKFGILFAQIDEPIDRAEAFGRIAFAVPYDTQPGIDELIKKNDQKIITELVTLDTPGKFF